MKIETTKIAVELLTDFFNVLSDGYNPSLIYFQYSENSPNIEKEIFVLPSHFGNDLENNYYNSIIKTKKEIKNLSLRISENFQWCSEHLIYFSKTPALFESKFHLGNFRELVLKVENKIFEITKNWEYEANEYLIDSRDGSLRRVVIIKSANKSITLDFGNYIH